MNNILEQNKAWIDSAWEKLDKKMQKVAVRSKNKIPYSATNGVHDNQVEIESKKNLSAAANQMLPPNHGPAWWTNGFWPGFMWVMYCGTKNDIYKSVAENGEKLLDKGFEDFDGLHHDVGFMWHISSGMNYRLFGGHDSYKRTMLAATILAGRYNIGGEFIRAWNGDKYGWTIIDTMMNIPLLYWATKESGDPRFSFIAQAHADMAMRDHVREDGSVNHIVSHDPANGEVIETFAGQGYSVGSSWSRGVSWALYGFILSYIHTKRKEYLDTAKKVANYFIANVCTTGYLPLCDFRSPAEPVIYDSTAGAVAACGLIEIAKNADNEYEGAMYMDAAIKILKAMEEKFVDYDENTDPVLLWGTERYTGGIHMPIIYGDYYYAEALYKLRGGDILFW